MKTAITTYLTSPTILLRCLFRQTILLTLALCTTCHAQAAVTNVTLDYYAVGMNQPGTLGRDDVMAVVYTKFSDPDNEAGFLCTDISHMHIAGGDFDNGLAHKSIAVEVAGVGFRTFDKFNDNSLFCIDRDTAVTNPPWYIFRDGTLNGPGPFYLTYGFTVLGRKPKP